MVLVSQIFPWLCVVLCDFFGFILIVLNKKFFLFVKKIYKVIFFTKKLVLINKFLLQSFFSILDKKNNLKL